MNRFAHRASEISSISSHEMMETLEETELCFPHLNSSCRKQTLPQTAVLLYVLPYSIGLLTATLNLLVIVSIAHFKQLHTPTNFLMLSLAISDFLVSIPICFQSHVADGCWFLSDLVCTLSGIFGYVLTSSSIGTMVLISVDRFVAICDPLHYQNKITVRGITVCTCLCWGCSVLYSSLLMKDNLKHPGRYRSCFGECVVVIDSIAGFVDFILSFICPVTVIVILYMRVFVVAASQARAMRSHVRARTSGHSKTLFTKKSELKAARTLGIVVIVFLLCLCPYYCAALADQSGLFSVTSMHLENWLAYFNSCLNPMIYAFCYPWFLKSVKLIVTFKILHPNSCQTRVL